MTRPPCICLVSPGHLSTNPRLFKEANALTDSGYDVQIVCGAYLAWAKAQDAGLVDPRWKIATVSFGAQETKPLHHVRQKLGQMAAGALFSMGMRASRITETAYARATPDLVRSACRMPPADLYVAHYVAALPAAARAAQLHAAKYAFDAEDFHFGDLPDAPRYAFEKRLIKQIEGAYLPSAAYVSAASPMIAEAYAQAYGIALPTTILNVFPRTNAPESPTPRGSVHPGPSLYWFSQTIGAGRGLETAIESIALANCRPHLYLRGTPAPGYETTLRSLAARSGASDRLHFLPLAPPADLERSGALFDVGLVSELNETRNRQIALTNKLFSYLTSGVPCVASDIPSHRRVAPDLGAAMSLFPIGDAAALAAAIDALLLNPDRLAAARAHAWELGQRRYSWEHEQAEFCAMLSQKALLPSGASRRGNST